MTNSTQTAALFARDLEDSFETFKVGDPVHFSQGTDVAPGTVVRLTKTRVIVRRVQATLLNGSGSGEPDALTCTPGGFVGHTSGTQRYAFGEMEGPEMVFSRRVKTVRRWDPDTGEHVDREVTIAKQQGTSMRGSMHSWGILRHGHRSHYDFNF